MELEEDLATEPNPLDGWRTLYLDYLLRDTLPIDKVSFKGSEIQVKKEYG